MKFLCGDRQFSEDRVRSGAKKLQKARGTSTQGRLDSFFKVLPSTPSTTPKRKPDDKKLLGSANKKAKTSFGSAKKPGRKPK